MNTYVFINFFFFIILNLSNLVPLKFGNQDRIQVRWSALNLEKSRSKLDQKQCNQTFIMILNCLALLETLLEVELYFYY